MSQTDREKILASMPQVTILRLPTEHHGLPGHARCDKAPWEIRSVVDLIVGSKVVGLDADWFTDTLEFEFQYEKWVRNPQLAISASYPSTPWRERNEVRIAVEREVIWVRTEFVATDAYMPKEIPQQPITYQYDADGIAKGLEPYDPEKHALLPGGWDHEHCDMCFTRINKDKPWCYATEDGGWLCVPCHQKYAVEGSLDFLVGYTNETHP